MKCFCSSTYALDNFHNNKWLLYALTTRQNLKKIDEKQVILILTQYIIIIIMNHFVDQLSSTRGVQTGICNFSSRCESVHFEIIGSKITPTWSNRSTWLSSIGDTFTYTLSASSRTFHMIQMHEITTSYFKTMYIYFLNIKIKLNTGIKG